MFVHREPLIFIMPLMATITLLPLVYSTCMASTAQDEKGYNPPFSGKPVSIKQVPLCGSGCYYCHYAHTIQWKLSEAQKSLFSELLLMQWEPLSHIRSIEEDEEEGGGEGDITEVYFSRPCQLPAFMPQACLSIIVLTQCCYSSYPQTSECFSSAFSFRQASQSWTLRMKGQRSTNTILCSHVYQYPVYINWPRTKLNTEATKSILLHIHSWNENNSMTKSICAHTTALTLAVL